MVRSTASAAPLARFAARCALILAASLGCSTASAATMTYYLDQSNDAAFADDAADYLKVTLNTTGTGVDFVLEILDAVNQYATGNYGTMSFGFNTSAAADSIRSANFVGLPAGWTVNANRNQNGFGRYDWVVSGTGMSRQAPWVAFSLQAAGGGAGSISQNLSDYAAASSGGAAQGNHFFAAHVAGFQVPGSSATSAFFGGSSTVPAPVPLPAAGWLLLAGIGALLGATGRRRELAAAT